MSNSQSSSNRDVHCNSGASELATPLAVAADSSGSIKFKYRNRSKVNLNSGVCCSHSTVTFNLHLITWPIAVEHSYPLHRYIIYYNLLCQERPFRILHRGLDVGLKVKTLKGAAANQGNKKVSGPLVPLFVPCIVLTPFLIELPAPLGRPVRSTRGSGNSYVDRLTDLSDKIQGNRQGKQQARGFNASKSKAVVPEDVPENAMAPIRKTSRSQAAVSSHSLS